MLHQGLTLSFHAFCSVGHNLCRKEILRLFREDGEVITMAEDGVNHAPTPKLPDIGIAMGVARLR